MVTQGENKLPPAQYTSEPQYSYRFWKPYEITSRGAETEKKNLKQISKTQILASVNFGKMQMLTKRKYHQSVNVTKMQMSPKLKSHQRANVTKTQM